MIQGISNWQSSSVINFVEKRTGKNLSCPYKILLLSTVYGLITGLIISSIEMVISFLIHNRFSLTYEPSIFLILFYQGAIFGFLNFTVLITSHDIKRRIKISETPNIFRLTLVSVLSTVLIFLISFIYFVYFSPARFIEAPTLSTQHCNAPYCLTVSRTTAASADSTPLEDMSNQPAETSGGTGNANKFKHLTKKEFDEYLEATGFDEFNIESTSKKIASSMGEISLFSEKNKVDWNQFLEELEQSTIESPRYADIKIMSALINEAPFEIVLEIMNRGHQLNGSHLLTLASYFTVDEFKKLENYGVDLSLPSGDGSNVLVRSLLNKAGPELFEYLLSKDELVLNDDIDIVKEVLMLSGRLNRPVKYVKMLIERGAPVTEDTKKWIESDLRKNNFKYYAVVKSRLMP